MKTMKMYTCLSILSLLTFRCASGCSENSGDKNQDGNKTNSQDVVRPNDSSSVSNEETESEKNLTFAVADEAKKTCKVTGYQKFYNDERDNTITIPNRHDGYTVVGVDDYSFSRAKNITSVEVPDSVVTLGQSAFYDCVALASITLPSAVTTRGENCFKGCTSLPTITLPASLSAVSDNCFDGCTSLTSIEIPDQVKTIGKYAFNECSSLADVHFGTGVETLGECSFFAIAVKKLELPSNIKVVGPRSFYRCEAMTEVTFNEGLTTLGSLSFGNCTALKEISLPSTLNQFVSGESTFGKGSTFEECKSLTSAVLGKGRQSLPSDFFSGCLNLAKVYIPKNIVTVEYEAFGAPTYIKDVYYSGSEEEWKAIDISESDLNKLTNSATIHYNQNF